MKINGLKIVIASIFLAIVQFVSGQTQKHVDPKHEYNEHGEAIDKFWLPLDFDKDSLSGFNEEAAWIQSRNNYQELWQQKRYVAVLKRDYINSKYSLHPLYSSTNPTPQAPCTNVDFETGNTTGWTLQQCENTNSQTMTFGACSAVTQTAICAPAYTDPNVPISGPSPLGGNFFRMGNMTTGGYSYRISQTFNVTAASAAFTFCYAVVLEDGSHACNQQPFFNVTFKDCSGNPIPCSAFFSTSPGTACSSGDPSFIASGSYKYKNWVTSAFDLSPQIGSCVTIEFTVGGCVITQGAHAGYCYIDAECKPMTLSLNGNVIPSGQVNNYLCQGSTTNNLCAPLGFTYSWNGPGVTGQTGQCVNATTTGSYSVTLGQANASCFSPVLYSNFTFTSKPIADFNYTVAPCSSTFSVPVMDNSNPNGGSAINYWTWDWGDGSAFSTTQNASHTYASTGTKNIELKVSNGGCSDSITKTINISAGPTASFTTSNLCTGKIASFTSASTPTTGLAAQNWNYGDGGSGSGASVQHTYSSAGTYTVKLVVTSSGLCKDSISKPITVYPAPTVAFTSGPVCFGSATNFTNNSSIASPNTISNWYWDFNNDGTVDNTTQSPSNTYTATGNYTVKLKATSNNGCSDSTTVPISVNPVPTVSFSTVNACVNSGVTLNNTSSIASPGSIAQWSWNFGTGASPGTASSQNPTGPIYTSSGVKTITLTATSNASCTATTTQTVNVNPQPTAAFAASTVCQGIATTFTDQSTPAAPAANAVTSWAWDFTSDGTIDNTTQSPSQTYGASGNYTTSLIVTSANGCKDTATVPVDVWGHASINFGPTNVCYGTATSFTNMTVTSTQPNTGGQQAWAWQYGDGNGSNSQNPVYTYTTGANTNTTYTVQLAVTTTHGCKDSLSKAVTVFALPTASFTSDSSCTTYPSHMVDASNGHGNTLTGYDWDFTNDGVADVSGTANPNYTFPTYGNNVVNYTVTTTPAAGLACKSSTTQNVWVNPSPVPAFSFTNTCINAQPMNYDASGSSIPTGTNSTYAWAYGDGQTGNGVTTTHTYANAAVYNVTLTVTSNKGCVKTLVKQTEVYQKPFVSFTSSKTCFGSPTTFSGASAPNSGNVTQWLWDFNNNIATIEGNGQQAPFSFASAGTKTVSLVTITDKNCHDTISRQIYVNYMPHPQFTVNKPAGCPELCVTFTDQTPAITGPSQIVNWIWRLGDGTVVNANTNSTQNHCYNNPSSSQLALYDITLIAVTDSACVDSMVKPGFITVYPTPIAAYTVNPNPGTVTEPLEYFNNQSQDYTKWWWGFGDGPLKQDSVNVDPTHFYSDANAATYPTQLIVANQYGCRDTAYVKVEIGPEFVFYIPNCFTPGNDDGINDGFIGKGIGITKYEMWIFDRWGNMIYYCDDINKPWDGRVQGKPQPVQQDVYVWKVKLLDVFAKKHDYVGHVTVLRGGGNGN